MRYPLRPYVLSLRTTERCEVGCSHCSISARPTGRDLPRALAVEAIQTAAGAGLGLLHLSGGEPLLYAELPALVEAGRAAGMAVEMVTSTFSQDNDETEVLALVPRLAACGLGTVLLSYDDGHARRISVARFARFARAVVDAGLRICVFGLEAPHVAMNVARVADALAREGVDPGRVEWAGTMFSYVGRGEASLSLRPLPERPPAARCPYVGIVPTLAPDGDVLLCPCSLLHARRFVIGHWRDGLARVLDELSRSPVYRLLGALGPHRSLARCGVPLEAAPVELCRACEMYLDVVDRKSPDELEAIFAGEPLEEVWVDYEALLPPHRRYLREHIGHAGDPDPA